MNTDLNAGLLYESSCCVGDFKNKVPKEDVLIKRLVCVSRDMQFEAEAGGRRDRGDKGG